jgi:large conductance mechanosensitive channel
MIKDFKEFALKGNVLDLAIGVIIGGAFGKIVTSLVNDVIMPALGVLLGGVNFEHLKLVIVEKLYPAAGDAAEVAIMYGAFIQSVVDFLIIAFSIFLFIKLISFRKKKAAEEKKEEPAPEPAKDVLLLEEIRDILKANQ